MRERKSIAAPVTLPGNIKQHSVRQHNRHTNALTELFYGAIRRSRELVPRIPSPLGPTLLWETLLRETRLRELSTPLRSPQVQSAPRISSQPMSVNGLNHFNITASSTLIEKVKQFYIDIVGLTVGPRAHLDHGGYWLYAGKQPILHLSAQPNIEQSKAKGEGFFNHISLSCVGLQATVSKMLATGTPYRVIELSDLGQTQIFITDPAGIGVELTFFDEQCIPSRLCSSLQVADL